MSSETTIAVEPRRKPDSLSVSALRTLLYYDLFRYPLTAEEILYHNLQTDSSIKELKESLHKLCDDELIYRFEEFYSLRDDPQLVERRKKGNKMAAAMLKTAARKSKFISRFPYVRAVCVSGSLSKNYFDESTDIDFFIITQPNRLWLCRSLLILYKKIFLLNSKKYFCVNYFIDSENLEIPDKNIFTATEIITLIPLYNKELYHQFFLRNNWVKKIFPNSLPLKNSHPDQPGNNSLKRITEKLFNTVAGEWLDRYFYRITVKQWRKKFPDFSDEEFEVNMRSRKDVSKHHPQGFQFRVLQAFEDNCRGFEEKHQVPLQ